MQKIALLFSWLLLCILGSQAQPAKNNDADSIKVTERTLAFLTTLNNLTWEDFKSFLAEDATAFLESDTLTLLDGKPGVEKMFKPIFDETPKYVKGPPYLHLQPVNMHVCTGKDMAIVSFHLVRANSIARRTLVWRKRGKTWLIIHIHGSVIKSGS